MKKLYFFTLITLVGICSSCEFKETPFDKYDVEFVFDNIKKAEGYVLAVYGGAMPYTISNNNGYYTTAGAMFSSASDESVHSTNSTITTLTDGSLTAKKSNPDNAWGGSYTSVRDVNIGLANLYRLPSSEYAPMLRLRGELMYIRALVYFELVKRYGGVPIITEVLEADGNLNIPRNTFSECVDFITSECDLAIKYLPRPENAEFGRASTGAALALKGRMQLYAASPLYNSAGYDGNANEYVCYGSYDVKRWKDAAQTAHDIIAMDRYNLYKPKNIAAGASNSTVIANGETNYRDLFTVISGNSELIISSTSAQSNNIEKKNTPVGFTNGQGLTSPSQQMVDAYGMVDGMTIAASANYDPSDPYTNRDPRFYASIFYNGQMWPKTSPRAIETFVGGVDNPQGAPTATRTGYYMSKFCSSGVAISGTQGATYHCFPLFRYAEVLLNYAEAMNEAYGPDSDPGGYGKTAREALVEVRCRVLSPEAAEVNVVSGGKIAMRMAIRAERRVELAFEGHRLYDLKRWMIAESVLNENIKGVTITNSSGMFTYTPNNNVETRIFPQKMYIYPIPNNDVIKNSAIIANNPLW